MQTRYKDSGKIDKHLLLHYFFANNTAGNLYFKHNIVELTHKSLTLSPQQLVDECKRCREEGAELAIFDQQTFDIIDLIEVNDPFFSWHLLLDAKRSISRSSCSLIEIIFGNKFQKHLLSNLCFLFSAEAIPVRVLLFQLFSGNEVYIPMMHKGSILD